MTRDPMCAQDGAEPAAAMDGGYPAGTAGHPSPPAFLWHRRFPGRADQVRAVRHWIGSLLPGCGPLDDLVLIGDELAANAVRHTRSGAPGGWFTIDLAWSAGSARIAAGDQGSARVPAMRPAGGGGIAYGEGGRGLQVIAGLASRWGHTGTGRRWVWADVPWSAQGGPARVDPGGALPAAEAIRRMRTAYPGLLAGYGGDPPFWRAQLPGTWSPDREIAAPCFSALIELAAAPAPLAAPAPPATPAADGGLTWGGREDDARSA